MIDRLHLCLAFSKVVFTVVLICFGVLHGVMLAFSGFMGSSEQAEFFIQFLCGVIYLWGSVRSFRIVLSIRSMLLRGLLLNTVGAVVWVPAIGSSESFFAVLGAILMAIWIVCIILRINFGEQVTAQNPVKR